MRAAADLEDGSEKHVAMENRLYPMRELLADMLMQQGDAASALTEYEVSMKTRAEPAARLLRRGQAPPTAVGDAKKTVEYTRSLAQLTRNADSDRAEIRDARLLITSR